MNNQILPSPTPMDSRLDFPMLFHVGKFNWDKANELLCFLLEKNEAHAVWDFFLHFRQPENKLKEVILCLVCFFPHPTVDEPSPSLTRQGPNLKYSLQNVKEKV